MPDDLRRPAIFAVDGDGRIARLVGIKIDKPSDIFVYLGTFGAVIGTIGWGFEGFTTANIANVTVLVTKRAGEFTVKCF